MKLFLDLWLALAVGLLIGAERGWQKRTAAEGGRIAGIRTFGLVGLLGGLWAVLGREFGDILLGFSFAAVAALMILAHVLDPDRERDRSITSVVAALVTFALGALAVRGFEAVAAAGAVITATLLSLKPVLHRWLQQLEPEELYGTLKLLLISVVLLPVLPNQGYGPWHALNPREVWLMVVLIASISFAGYFAMKIAGTRRGILYTAILGGLASSTAVTLSMSRIATKRSTLAPLLSAGVLAACATMFPRMLLAIAVINPNLVLPALAPLAIMGLVTLAAAGWILQRSPRSGDPGEVPLRNPFELGPALKFGLLLAAVMVLAQAFKAWLGHTGIYLLAGLSGLSDVDAITLSLAGMARSDLAAHVAVDAIVLAAMANSVVKGGMALAIGGRAMGWRVAAGMGASIVAGALAVYWL